MGVMDASYLTKLYHVLVLASVILDTRKPERTIVHAAPPFEDQRRDERPTPSAFECYSFYSSRGKS